MYTWSCTSLLKITQLLLPGSRISHNFYQDLTGPTWYRPCPLLQPPPCFLHFSHASLPVSWVHPVIFCRTVFARAVPSSWQLVSSSTDLGNSHLWPSQSTLFPFSTTLTRSNPLIIYDHSSHLSFGRWFMLNSLHSFERLFDVCVAHRHCSEKKVVMTNLFTTT